MCSYREKKPDPTEMMQLEGYTVDYFEPRQGKKVLVSDLSAVCLLLNVMNLCEVCDAVTEHLKLRGV